LTTTNNEISKALYEGQRDHYNSSKRIQVNKILQPDTSKFFCCEGQLISKNTNQKMLVTNKTITCLHAQLQN
jgi:hypothetical protein